MQLTERVRLHVPAAAPAPPVAGRKGVINIDAQMRQPVQLMLLWSLTAGPRERVGGAKRFGVLATRLVAALRGLGEFQDFGELLV
jgi:hypothetical protein